MRIWERKVLTTLSEDEDIFRAIIDAIGKYPSEVQLRLLGRVKHQMLNLNNDLVRGLYEDFIRTIDALDVSHPFETHQDDPRTGSRYQIPAAGNTHGKTPGKMTREERLSVRSMSRKEQWDLQARLAGYTVEQLDLLLAVPDSVIGNIRDEFLEIVDAQEVKHLAAINAIKKEHAHEMDELVVRIEAYLNELFDQFDGRVTKLELFATDDLAKERNRGSQMVTKYATRQGRTN